MKKIPRKVRLTSSVSYEVVYVDKFDDEDTVGECRSDSHQIVLKKGQSKTEMFKTFLHELCHAVEFEYGVAIPHEAIYKAEEAIERLIVLNKW